MAACESGALSVCEDLGDLEWNNSQPDSARRWWDRACERGRLQSCLFGRRFSPTTSATEAQTYKERCVQGEARACTQLADLVSRLTPAIEELRRQGGRQTSAGAPARIEAKRHELVALCEAGDAAMCDGLGELEWDTQRHDEAARWWDRACEYGRFQSCLLGNRYNPLPQVRDRVLGLQSRCRQGHADACREIEATVNAHRRRIDAMLTENRQAGVASGTKR
jgi:TPR repeat protein